MEKHFGEPLKHDPNHTGPVHNRSCTDIFALIPFLCFMVVWILVGIYAMKNGTVGNMITPTDSEGRQCGISPGVENKKYLVYFNILECLKPATLFTTCKTHQVCMENCPNGNILPYDIVSDKVDHLRKHLVCNDKVKISDATFYDIVKHIQDGSCAPYVVKSTAVLHRCFPTPERFEFLLEKAKDLAGNMDKKQTHDSMNFIQMLSRILYDLVQSKWYMLGGLGVVLVICFLYILLLRWVVVPVVWSTILAMLGISGFCVYLSYTQYIYYKDQVKSDLKLELKLNPKYYSDSIFHRSDTWLILLILSGIILLILLLIAIFLRKRINLAIKLIQEGSKAIFAVKSTVFFPIFPWAIQCLAIVYAVGVGIFVLSIEGPTYDYKNIKSAMYLHAANLFAFFWFMLYIDGVADMMLAGTFSTWYWTFDKRDLPFFTLSSSICRTTRYHLGTAAFGSLIVAIVRLFRVFLQLISKSKGNNILARAILCVCKCLCSLLENFLRFLNRNAFIMCAMQGASLCVSARNAFSLLMRNIVRVVVLDKVSTFIFFLSKIVLAVGVGFGIFYLLKLDFVYDHSSLERLNYAYIPAIILGVATYLISMIFFNVYEMAVGTVFLCYLEDCERNDGSAEKPYYMSKKLMKILKKKNKEN